MEIQDHLDKLKKLHSIVLDYIDKDDHIEENFENLCNFIKEQKLTKSGSEFKLFLRLISSISDNHYRANNFFEKIERIIIKYKTIIQKFYSKEELCVIFQNNKRLLFFLLNEKMIIFDEFVLKTIIEKRYSKYFIPEIKKFDPKNTPFTSDLKDIFRIVIPKDFDEKRKIGENNNKICEIIRNDLIDEFISYVEQFNYPLNSMIEPSIYETNLLLLSKTPNLIEYAAFFGACQIFNYLFFNGAKIEPSLWIYGVHSDNSMMIHLLEEKQIKPNEGKNKYQYNEIFPFKESVIESIMCHNNLVAIYILNNYENEKTKKSENGNFQNKIEKYIESKSFEYYNFGFFPEKVVNNDIFVYLCLYDYQPLVKTFLSTRKINIESIAIINR